MGWVILNSKKWVETNSNMEVAEWSLQLQATQVEDATRKTEELSGTEQQSQQVVQKDPKLK